MSKDTIFCQNLVPNGNFEFFISCPQYQNQVEKAYPWFNPTGNSPDYLNACYNWPNPQWFVDVPINLWGYQYAHSGQGFCGIAVIYGSPDGREYIENKLLDTLSNGRKYLTEFFVSLCDSCKYGADRVGTYFSKDSVFDHTWPDLLVLPYIPQIENSVGNLIVDKENWVRISDEFIANGGEQFIVIGNFRLDSLTIIDTLDKTTKWNAGYYYIDDISVYCVDSGYTTANGGSDKLVCAGDSVQLGTPPQSGFMYNWSPTYGMDPIAGLDSAGATQAQPWVKPQKTTTYILTVVDTVRECRGPGHDSVTVTVCSGVDELRAAGYRLRVYPNPGNEKITVTVPSFNERENLTVIVSDITGRKIKTCHLTENPLIINSDELDNGIYFLTLYDGLQFAGSKKLVVAK